MTRTMAHECNKVCVGVGVCMCVSLGTAVFPVVNAWDFTKCWKLVQQTGHLIT